MAAACFTVLTKVLKANDEGMRLYPFYSYTALYTIIIITAVIFYPYMHKVAMKIADMISKGNNTELHSPNLRISILSVLNHVICNVTAELFFLVAIHKQRSNLRFTG